MNPVTMPKVIEAIIGVVEVVMLIVLALWLMGPVQTSLHEVHHMPKGQAAWMVLLMFATACAFFIAMKNARMAEMGDESE